MSTSKAGDSNVSWMLLINAIIYYIYLSVCFDCASSLPLQWIALPSDTRNGDQNIPSSSSSSDASNDPLIARLIGGQLGDILAETDSKDQDQSSSREKRSGISDQRLAELEALQTLRRRFQNSKARSHGFGQIDFEKIGKRKRRDRQVDRYPLSSSSIFA